MTPPIFDPIQNLSDEGLSFLLSLSSENAIQIPRSDATRPARLLRPIDTHLRSGGDDECYRRRGR